VYPLFQDRHRLVSQNKGARCLSTQVLDLLSKINFRQGLPRELNAQTKSQFAVTQFLLLMLPIISYC
jgi:hypothetical protein